MTNTRGRLGTARRKDIFSLLLRGSVFLLPACGAVGAVARYPGRNIVIIDFGTATTVEAVNSKQEYLGGAIVPGLGISMRALEQNTARLPKVEIVRPDINDQLGYI